MSRYATVGARASYPAAQRLLQIDTDFLRVKQPGDSFAVAGGELQSHSGLPAMTPTNPHVLTSLNPVVIDPVVIDAPRERRYHYARWGVTQAPGGS